MKTSLVIMAAGIGSRYGGGIKQLEHMDDHNHIIMDYSIYDAIDAGFNKIIFVIRKDIEDDFREIIGNRIEEICRKNDVEVCYAFQSLEDIPIECPADRQKPWGTGQAVLAAKSFIHEPFAVINADDYYGKSAFSLIHDHLTMHPTECCMAGFILRNTLSENGGVTRGICEVDANSDLTGIVETRNIVKTATGAAVNGQPIDVNTHVSMNMWGGPADFISLLEQGFMEFFAETTDILKDEFLIPIYVGKLLEQKKISVKVLETHDSWFGITYQEDKPFVKSCFEKLISSGVYQKDLYSSLSRSHDCC